MIDLNDSENKDGKSKRYHLYCDVCKSSRGYGMKSRAHQLCKKCMTKNSHLKECHRIAEEKGGKLLSQEWVSSTSLYRFQCSCSHEWETYSYVVRRGSWCPSCSPQEAGNKNRKKSVEYCREIALSKGGKFLSEVYKKDKDKYLWQCSGGHTWETRLTVVEDGSWCPDCFSANSKFRRRENQLREIVESIFNKKFPSVRPDWLINPETGYKMELDCYNEKLKLAFEYDGELHYKSVKFFNNDVGLQVKRDRIKDELCKSAGVKLIRLSYKDKHNIESFIREAINELV